MDWGCRTGMEWGCEPAAVGGSTWEGVPFHPSPCSCALRSRGNLFPCKDFGPRLCRGLALDEDERWLCRGCRAGPCRALPDGTKGDSFAPNNVFSHHCPLTAENNWEHRITFPVGPGSHAGKGEMNPWARHRDSPIRGTKTHGFPSQRVEAR